MRKLHRMSGHRPNPSARRDAMRIAERIGADIETSRTALARSLDQVARRAGVAPSTVMRAIRGDPGIHLDTLFAIGAAAGLRMSVKAYPAALSLRDSGQLRIANYIVQQAHPSLTAALEVPVGDPFGRAADVVLFGATEIVHSEIERRLPDLQAPYRAATVKRDSLQSQHQRPVRLVLVVEDTRRNRDLVAPHADLLRRILPATSSEVMRALRSGAPLGRDGLLWVRPWRSRGTDSSVQTTPPAPGRSGTPPFIGVSRAGTTHLSPTGRQAMR